MHTNTSAYVTQYYYRFCIQIFIHDTVLQLTVLKKITIQSLVINEYVLFTSRVINRSPLKNKIYITNKLERHTNIRE